MQELTLSPPLLRQAYAQGFFPMPHPETGEILWFNPDPRAVIPLDGLHISRSLARTLRRGVYTVTIDRDFAGVMAGCGERAETWITDEFKQVYGELHKQGDAHSVEVWRGSELVGGLYGIALHGAFFAESKFHRATDASKVAVVHLVRHLQQCGMLLLEVQFLTEHLETLGAREIPRQAYLGLLRQALRSPASFLTPLPAAAGDAGVPTAGD